MEASLVHSYPPNGKTTSPPAPQHTRAVGTQTTGDILASPAVVKTPRSRKSISDITVTPSTYVILHDNDDSGWKGNHRSHQVSFLLSPPLMSVYCMSHASRVQTIIPTWYPCTALTPVTPLDPTLHVSLVCGVYSE